MKLVARSFGLLALLGISPSACGVTTTELPLDDMCAQMGLETYDYLPVGNIPIGNFEPTTEDGNIISGVDEGAMIVDDDDLTDDYPVYLEGRALYDQLLAEHPEYKVAVDAYEASDSTNPPGTVPELKDLVDALSAVCKNYASYNLTPANGVAPLFTSCKDKWNQNGDGVVGMVNLAQSESLQDQALSKCQTVGEAPLGGRPNHHAVNFWGPISTFTTDHKEQEVTYDGFPYSGITIPLTISPYLTSADISEWEGVAFWARLASAEEAVPFDSPQVMAAPVGRELPANPEPQDGVGQLGVMVQTSDTGAVDPDGRVAFTIDSQCTFDDADAGPCFPTQADFDAFNAPVVEEKAPDGSTIQVKYGLTDGHGYPGDVPQPFCIDYSPIDATVGEEVPYRNQCWDGFRSTLEITKQWKFYFVPFEKMRQAGWGQVASTFRLDQMRSVDFITSAYQPVNVMVDEVAYYRRKP